MVNSKSFTVDMIDNNVAVLCMDIPGEKQNTLRAEFAEEINQILDELEGESLHGIIITSGKKNSFVVGADINMLSSLQTSEQILEITSAGYAVFNRIEQLKIPVVAEIHGACMGGGLELALACHGRVCSNHSSSILALPEVQLGLLPGGGGTQRLPALIGITEALGMMTTGRNIRPVKALKMGLIDDLTDPVNLRIATLKKLDLLSKITNGKQSFDLNSLLSIKGWQTLLLEKNPAGLSFLFRQARKKAYSKTRGNYPAVEKIIDCVEDWSTGNKELGYKTEAQYFAELVLSPEAKNLISLFFAITELKKDPIVDSAVSAKDIKKLGVIGGGLMGAGIAFVSANNTKAAVRVCDVTESGVNHALKYAWSKLLTSVQKRYISRPLALAKMGKLTAGTDYTGFANADLVIEAVFESLELKHQILKDVESNCKKDTIFATNTSSIPITDIASVAKRPENVIGMHYFSPVEKMPLLELVVTDKTADHVIATTVAFGREQGKTVIVVNDGAGFYTSRVLGAYMNEAGHIIQEGVAVEKIDRALKNFGYPVGPMTLLDEVGIDVGFKIIPILEEAFGERMKPAKAFTRLVDAGRQGKKNKKGFYDYSVKSQSKRPVDQSVYTDLGIQPGKAMEADIISERCNLMLVNEAARCIEEGILKSPRDGDIGAIFGLGFPAYLGGPFKYADNVGIAELVKLLEHYQNSINQRFAPASLLVSMADNGETFY